MRTNHLSIVALLVATLGLAGCQDDPARDDPACPIGFVDGGDGRCAPGGSCSKGYRHAGNWTCVSDEGPCPAGYTTSGKNDFCCASGYHDGGDETCVRQGVCSPGYVHNGRGCEAQSVNPEAPELDAPAYVTAGESYTARVENPVATSTYAWTITGGTLATNSGVSVVFTAESSGTVILSCIETNQAGARSQAGKTTSAIVQRPVVSGIEAPQYVTAGASYTASVENPVATSTYAWTIIGGTLATNFGVSVVFTAESSGTVSLSCVETNRAGTPGQASTAASAIVPMPVIPEIEVPENIVAWESYTASIKNPVATSAYAWTVKGGTLETNSGVSVVFTAGNHGTVALSCVEINKAGTKGKAGTATRSFVPEGIDIATQVATGGSHTCALKTDGGVSCWGDNTHGQLGDGTSTDSYVPVEVTGLSNGITAIAAGGGHTCALTDSGVSCWGDNSRGQLGNGTTTGSNAPVAVSGLSSGITAIAMGVEHTCVLSSGSVSCWGDNTYGQLGDGATTSSTTPIEVTGLSSDIAAVATGGEHTCVLNTNGGVSCWGSNSSGQLGNGTTTSSTAPVEVKGLSSGVAAIAAGGEHTCALKTNGNVSCWGRTQIENGTFTELTTPVEVKGLSSGVIAITAGDEHSCALMTDGGASCWGLNTSGQLANDVTGIRGAAVEARNLSKNAASIDAGGDHTCVLMTNGGISCWGDNAHGQLGVSLGIFLRSPTPIEAANISSGIAIAAGERHNCVVETNGSVSCWGDNTFGQLGNGTTIVVDAPVEVTGLSSGITAIGLGVTHTCALTTDGGVSCWGGNSVGLLGNGTTAGSATPVEATGLSSGVVAIAAGDAHTCALKTNGEVSCWGDNNWGQLGKSGSASTTPVVVLGLSRSVKAIAAGGDHACVLMTDGSVGCWGANYRSQLGRSASRSEALGLVTGLSSGVAAITAGREHTCALKTNGSVMCWGSNTSGQLGNGTSTDSHVPVEVTGPSSGITAITAGAYGTCALETSGRVSCWGGNSSGHLGNGTTTSSTTPVEVTGLSSGVTAIAAGGEHVCALNVNGRVSCWGSNSSGRLGVPQFSTSSTPVEVAGFVSAPPR